MVKTSSIVALIIGLIVISMMGVFVAKITDAMPYIHTIESIDFSDNETITEEARSELLKTIPGIYDFMNMFLVVVVLMIFIIVVADIVDKNKIKHREGYV